MSMTSPPSASSSAWRSTSASTIAAASVKPCSSKARRISSTSTLLMVVSGAAERTRGRSRGGQPPRPRDVEAVVGVDAGLLVLSSEGIRAARFPIPPDVIDLEHGDACGGELARQQREPLRHVRVVLELKPVQDERLGHAVDHGEGRLSG